VSVKTIEGARASEMPGFIKPQLATLKSRAPAGNQWLHEIKYDGYRLQIHLNKGKRRAFTRNGLDWIKRFSVIAGALDIPGQAILDGEAVCEKASKSAPSIARWINSLARRSASGPRADSQYGTSSSSDLRCFIHASACEPRHLGQCLLRQLL
jgi:hypothetical protein